MNPAIIIILTLALMGVILFLLVSRRKDQQRADEHEAKIRDRWARKKGVMHDLNTNRTINNLGNKFGAGSKKMQQLFARSMNPWHMSPAVFQFIRIGGAVAGVVIGLALIPINGALVLFGLMLAFLAFWYPMYYYKAIIAEREAEWTKLYQFIWVISNNATMYDAQRVFLETSMYIKQSHPEFQELIRGFEDFYDYWDPNEIPEYLKETYFFIPIAKEAYSLMFNMNATGIFPADQIAQFRQFIINKQDMRVEKVLSNVAAKATIASLPFLMMSCVVALLVPMLVTFINLM